MSTNQNVPKAPAPEQSQVYNSNPFTLSFDAFGRFFNTNKNWAIALIVLGVLGGIGRSFGNIIQVFMDGSGYSDSKTSSSTAGSFGSVNSTEIIAIVVIVFVIAIIFTIVSSLVDAFVRGMLSYVALQSEKGMSVSLSEAFNEAGKRFGRLFGATLLANLKIFGWTLLFIVPGIIAGFRYHLLPFVIMAEPSTEKGIGDSHTKTKALVKGRVMEVFGVSTVAAIIPFVGSIIGLAGSSSLHNQLQATSSSPESRPRVHWLNYLGFMLGAFLLLIILLIAGVIVFSVLKK